MFRTATSTLALVSVLAIPAMAQDEANPLEGAEAIPLLEWGQQDVYAGGLSAEDFIDEMEVYGTDGEDIGDLEDIIIGADGQVLAIVAEVGGFWDIGDTHVSVPFSEVEVSEAGDGVIIPVTEENVGDYGFFETDVPEPDVAAADTVESEIVEGVDDEPLARAWRVSELIGDYARLVGDGDPLNYGYITDVILKDGAVSAVIVQPAYEYGGGYQAYPYASPGWTPEMPYYDMPYEELEVGDVAPFDYERLGGE